MIKNAVIARQRAIALEYYGGNATQQELSQKYNVSQSTISTDAKFGGFMILDDCDIVATDSIATAREKAAERGYLNPVAVGNILENFKQSLQ